MAVTKKLKNLIKSLDAEVEFYTEHEDSFILQKISQQGREDRIIQLIENTLNHTENEDISYHIGISEKGIDLLMDLMYLNDTDSLRII